MTLRALVVWGAAVCSHRFMQASPQVPQNSDRHPFGGCNRLLEQYQSIGKSLLTYEKRVGGALIPVQRYVKDFSRSVAFIPVEVLESYLDDLLDLSVCDESLFVKKARLSKRASALLLVTLSTVGYLLWLGKSADTSFSVPMLLLIAFFAGLGSALYFLPRSRVLRRFSFATLVSREIAKRRGHDKTSMGDFASKLLTREFWVGRHGGSVANLPPHPARVVVRYYH